MALATESSIRQWFEGQLKVRLARLNGERERGTLAVLGKQIVADEFGDELDSCSPRLREYVEWSAPLVASNVNVVARNAEQTKLRRSGDKARETAGTTQGKQQRERVKKASEKRTKAALAGNFMITLPDGTNVVLRNATSDNLRQYAEGFRDSAKADLTQADFYDADADEMERKKMSTYGELLDLRENQE